MSKRFCMVFCSNYNYELNEISGEKLLQNFDFKTFPAKSFKVNSNHDYSIDYLNFSGYEKVFIYTCGCFNKNNVILPRNVEIINLNQCFELFLDKNVVSYFIKEKCYLVTSGWLSNLKNNIMDWGFDAKTAPEFFDEFCTQILFCETVKREDNENKIKEFSNFVGKPYKILECGLDYFKNKIISIAEKHKKSALVSKTTKRKSSYQKQLADYAVAMDLFHNFSQSVNEQQVIFKIKEMINVLFAPEEIKYIPVDEDTHDIFNNSEITSDDKHLFDNFKGNYKIIDNEKSFIMKISYYDRCLGYILIRNIAFPQYLSHYINLANLISIESGLVIINVRTVHELKNALIEQEADKKEINELVTILEKRNNELNNALKIAEEASRIKSEFLGIISHELRTPLSTIIGFSGLALHEENISEDIKEYSGYIHHAAVGLLELLDGLLEMSVLEAGRIQIEYTEIDILKMIQDIYILLKEKIANKNNVFKSSTNGIEKILSDKLKVQQLLFNLIGNAVKFTDNGVIEIELTENSNHYQFCISDTGIGIDINNQKKIFESFSQADSTIKRKFGGTGLGLAICKKIIESLKGEIWVQSELGKGSQFYFTIPKTSV